MNKSIFNRTPNQLYFFSGFTCHFFRTFATFRAICEFKISPFWKRHIFSYQHRSSNTNRWTWTLSLNCHLSIKVKTNYLFRYAKCWLSFRNEWDCSPNTFLCIQNIETISRNHSEWFFLHIYFRFARGKIYLVQVWKHSPHVLYNRTILRKKCVSFIFWLFVLSFNLIQRFFHIRIYTDNRLTFVIKTWINRIYLPDCTSSHCERFTNEKLEKLMLSVGKCQWMLVHINETNSGSNSDLGWIRTI